MIALPSEGGEGGDLYALFSCGDSRYARIVLADSIGHGYTASGLAKQVHELLHRYSDVRDAAALLAALNDVFPPIGQVPGAPLHMITMVTATFQRDTGEFSYAYAAHPRMLERRALSGRCQPLGEGLEGLPLGVFSGAAFSEQSVKLEEGDLVMAFSDALTEVESPDGNELTARGFLELTQGVIAQLPSPISLHNLSESVMNAVRRFHGSDRFQDDLTLLTLRRLPRK